MLKDTVEQRKVWESYTQKFSAYSGFRFVLHRITLRNWWRRKALVVLESNKDNADAQLFFSLNSHRNNNSFREEALFYLISFIFPKFFIILKYS